MQSRDNILVQIRGEKIGLVNDQSSAEERFQNETLRPILKLQNDLFIQVFINYAVKRKGLFFSLSPEKKLSYIDDVVQRDLKFRNSLKGMIIGFFTLQEFAQYILNSSNLNKRMMSKLTDRIKSNMQLIELDHSN